MQNINLSQANTVLICKTDKKTDYLDLLKTRLIICVNTGA